MLTLLCLLITLLTITASALNPPPNPLIPFDAPSFLPPASTTTYIHPLLSTINYATATASPSEVTAAIQPGQLNAFNVSRPEGTRIFYLYVPSTYGQNRTVAHPLAFFFHGYGGSWQNGVSYNITNVAERMGWLLVLPQGWPGQSALLGWNAGRCCGFNASTIVDDVTFTKIMIRTVQSAVLVNPRRRYSMGWSNGAMFSERLACSQSDLFAGIAGDEGAVVLGFNGIEAGLSQCDTAFGNSRINYLHLHGTSDPTVSWTGNAMFPSTLQDVTRWVTRQNCSGRVLQNYNDGTFSNIVWPDCRDGREVELMTVRNGVHQWWTQQRGGFETAQYAFQWFDRTFYKQLAADEAREKEERAQKEEASEMPTMKLGRHAKMNL